MAEKTPIINIFTYHLPYDLANQIYNEFSDRYREANFIIANAQRYRSLSDHAKTVELLLALSIFHKRVICNLDAAVKFHGRVTRNSEATSIRIGSYEFTGDEKNKLLAVILSYNKLIEKYGITPMLMDYYLTKDFLLRLINLKKTFE